MKAFFFDKNGGKSTRNFQFYFFPLKQHGFGSCSPSKLMHFFTEKDIESVRREFQIVNVVVQEKEVISRWNGGVLFFFNPSELDVGDWNCCSRCIPFTEQLISSGEKKEKI